MWMAYNSNEVCIAWTQCSLNHVYLTCEVVLFKFMKVAYKSLVNLLCSPISSGLIICNHQIILSQFHNKVPFFPKNFTAYLAREKQTNSKQRWRQCSWMISISNFQPMHLNYPLGLKNKQNLEKKYCPSVLDWLISLLEEMIWANNVRCLFVCIYVYMYVCMGVCMCVVCMCVCMFVCMYVC